MRPGCKNMKFRPFSNRMALLLHLSCRTPSTLMRKLIAWTLLLSLYIGFVAPLARAEAQIVDRRTAELNLAIPDGLIFKLSDGNETAQGREKSGPAASQQIDDPGAVLKRLPPIKSDRTTLLILQSAREQNPLPKRAVGSPLSFRLLPKALQSDARPTSLSTCLDFLPRARSALHPI